MKILLGFGASHECSMQTIGADPRPGGNRHAYEESLRRFFFPTALSHFYGEFYFLLMSFYFRCKIIFRVLIHGSRMIGSFVIIKRLDEPEELDCMYIMIINIL